MSLVRVAFAIAAAALACAPIDAVAREWWRVVGEGDPLPGGGVFGYDGFGAPQIRADGAVVFDRPGTSFREKRFYSRASPDEPLALLALAGPEADYAGVSGLDVSGVDEPWHASARLVLGRSVSPAFCSDAFRWGVVQAIDDTGAVTNPFLPGVAAPGFDPGWIWFDEADELVVNEHGALAFRTRVAQTAACPVDAFTPYAEAIYRVDADGGVDRIAVDRHPVPGGAPNEVLLLLFHSEVAIDDQGAVVFAATIEKDPYGISAEAVLRWTPEAGLTVLARSDEPIGGVLYETWFPFGAISTRGGFASFVAGIDDRDTTAFFVANPDGSVAERVASDEPVPGFAPGRRYFGFDPVSDPFTTNARGDVAFQAVVTPESEGELAVYGVWGPDADGQISLKLLAGQAAPDPPDATVTGLRLVGLGDDRSVLVDAQLSTPQGPSRAFYLVAADGAVETLARGRGSIEVGGTHVATPFVLSIDATPNLDRFVIETDDGIYATVPEAGALASATAAVLAALFVARRRR